MIKVFCDVCEEEIEEWERCSSNKPAFQALMQETLADAQIGPMTFGVSIDLNGNGHANDVCKTCVKNIVSNMRTYTGEAATDDS